MTSRVAAQRYVTGGSRLDNSNNDPLPGVLCCFPATKMRLGRELLDATLLWYYSETLALFVRSNLEAPQALAHLPRSTEADSSRQECHHVKRRRYP